MIASYGLQGTFFSVEARIEQILSSVSAQENYIRSQFKVALLKLPRNVRTQKVEDQYYNDEAKEGVDLTQQLAKVAASVSSSVSQEVSTTVKGGSRKKTSTTVKTRRTTKKKSSILAAAPTTASLRRSTRKRFTTSTRLGDETPLASSTMTAAALGFTGAGGNTTVKSSRSRRVLQTPAGSSNMNLSIITPKFDMATPMTRTVMRAKRDDEKWLVSMQGSPVYIGGGARGGGGKSKSKQDNGKMIPIPIGDGKTLMVPADNPEVQPVLQKLIQTSMNIMNRS